MPELRLLFRFCPELREPGERLRFVTYMGTAMSAALPFRQRIAARIGARFMCRMLPEGES